MDISAIFGNPRYGTVRDLPYMDVFAIFGNPVRYGTRTVRDAIFGSQGSKVTFAPEPPAYTTYLFIEKGLRGGISMVSKRFAKANNKYLQDYDPEQPTSFIQYLDANNLYGWAMSQPLPTGNFKWSKTYKTDGAKGYILEVDLEYPKELHESHNSYPLAPEKLKVPYEWMSPYQKSLATPDVTAEKLIPNLRNKEKYVLHYRNLQLYCDLGMRVTKVHRVLEFDQSPWMEPYIKMNTELRKKAQTDFERDLYKLMNNSVFGKTMENQRKRVDVRLIRNTRKPSYGNSLQSQLLPDRRFSTMI